MAEFKKVIGFVLKEEGGYSCRKGDRGGETYGGVTRKNFPDWDGWIWVDAYIHNRGGSLANGSFIPGPEIQECLETFYYVNFWKHLLGDKIVSEVIARMLVDWGVNSGWYTAVKHLQKLVGVEADGHMGPASVKAINESCTFSEHTLAENYRAERIAFLNAIVEHDESQRGNLKGWLDRVNRLPGV